MKKYLKVLLVLFMLVTSIPFYGQGSMNVSAEENDEVEDNTIELVYEGNTVTEIVLQQNQHRNIVANYESENAKYQWQLCIPNTEIWVDITGMTENYCTLSYALLKNMLNIQGEACIRCEIVENGKVFYTNESDITISYNVDEQELAAQRSNSIEAVDRFSMFSLSRASEYVTIEIKYIYEDSTMDDISDNIEAFDSYTAYLQYGTAFTADVTSPSIVGYTPYKLEDNTDASIIHLEYASLSGNEIIYVVYKPALVNYRVRYYFQNITDDLYTENVALSEVLEGETGAFPDEGYVNAKFDGFTALFYEPETIAADGSTEFLCYYDRVYTLINFDLDGGYGVEPIYARYETPFVVNTPIKHGYVFAGWDKQDSNGDYDGVADELPKTMPLEKENYKAIWTIAETYYTFVYWLENENNDYYSYLGSAIVGGTLYDGEIVLNGTVHSADKVSGSDNLQTYLSDEDYDHYVYNDTLTDKSVIIEGDGSTVINIYYDREEYTLKFYYAMSSERTNATTYYVIGGTTYYFGGWASSNRNNEIKLLDQYMSSYTNHRGEVDELPTLNTKGRGRNYTLSFDSSTVNNTTYQYHYISFKAKYGQDISNLWPCDVFNSVTRKSANTHTNWSGKEAFVSAWNGEYNVRYSLDGTINNGNQTIKGKYEILDENLLWQTGKPDDMTISYLCFWENGANITWSVPELYRYNIYVPILEGQDTSNLTLKYNDGVTYYLLDSYDTCDNSNEEEQTKPSLLGFTYYKMEHSLITDFDASLYKEAYDINHFYNRRGDLKLTFTNYGVPIDEKNETLLYQQEIYNRYFVPDYPENLEPNAYYFDGWYTTAECYDGTKFDFGTEDSPATMPAKNLNLNASWKPVERTVKFYKQYSDIALGNVYEDNIYVVNHNAMITGNIPTVSIDGYKFVGWFYMLNGEKMAFDPTTMPVLRDMNLFAEWQSSIVVDYVVKYVDDETGEVIADPTIGKSYAGQTKTFTAKTGKQMYTDYQSMYFPITNSHSITMQKEVAGEDNPNMFTFKYVHLDNVPYTVNYINKLTGVVMDSIRYEENDKQVVTEKFQPFTGMIPDAYYKRLVLSANDNENIINFYYVPDTLHAYYAIHHWVQNLDDPTTVEDESTTYTEYAVIEGIGDLHTEITANPVTITGFYFDPTTTKNHARDEIVTVDGENKIIDDYSVIDDLYVSGDLNEYGLKLELYYKRNTYDYTVKYLEYGTGKVLSTEKAGEAKPIGTIIEEQSIVIDGYTLVSPLTQKLEIRSTDNELIFYYEIKKFTILYIPICTEAATDFGNVSLGMENIATLSAIQGSTPIPNINYEFVGWYSDPSCDEEYRITNDIDSNNKLKPSIMSDAIYYALFRPVSARLTINKIGANDDDHFLFQVEGISNNSTYKNIHVSQIVSIQGNGEVTIDHLPLGEYKITELTDWSWRYSVDGNAEQTVELVIKDTTYNVEYKNNLANDNWLGDEVSKDNRFNKID